VWYEIRNLKFEIFTGLYVLSNVAYLVALPLDLIQSASVASRPCLAVGPERVGTDTNGPGIQ